MANKEIKNRKKLWENKFRQTVINLKFHFPLHKRILSTSKFQPKIKEINSKFIYGKSRSGKTIYSLFLLLEGYKQLYIKHGDFRIENYVFISYSDLLLEIRSSFNSKEITEKEVREYYSKVKILVIDDWGTTKPTDWVYASFYDLIEKRMLYENITIITSNISLEKIEESWQDERITNRIRESYEVIKLPHWQGK